MNGKSYRGKPFVYDAETPGPADRRDVLALRSDFYRFQEDNDAALAAIDGKIDRLLTIQAATFSEITGRGVDTIPGIGEFARREARRRFAIQTTAAAVAIALVATLFGFLGGRGAAASTTHHEVTHAP